MADDETAGADARLVAALADIAALPLAPERIANLATLVASMRREYALLTGQSWDLEPAIIFDPRWD